MEKGIKSVNDDELTFSQEFYVSKILQQPSMVNEKIIDSSVSPDITYSNSVEAKEPLDVEPRKFRSLIESSMYLGLKTSPELCVSINMLGLNLLLQP